MRVLQWSIICFVILPFCVHGQSSDDQVFRAAVNVTSDTAKLGGLNRFMAAYPQSKLIGDAYGAKFSVLMTLHQDSAAFAAAHNYLAAKDLLNLPDALHDIAMELAFRKKYPDSALVLVDSAISLYQRKHGRASPIYLYTKATSLYLLSKFSDAESTQLEAIALLPPSGIFDPHYSNYYLHLGMIQLETHRGAEGLEPYVHASFVSSQSSADFVSLDSLFRSRVKDSTILIHVRDSLFERVANEYLRSAGNTPRAKRFIAESFSRNRVFTGRALQFAREAYRDAAVRTFEERCDAAASLGIVLANTGNIKEAEKFLNEALQTALPSESELFLALGSVQESLGKKNEALDTYLAGVIVSRPASIMKPLMALQKELYPRASIDSLIGLAQRRWVDFFPQKYERPDSLSDHPNHKTVLAELFTGSEFRPCQAADIAYNKLLERYDRSDLTILEYHLHIPKPDPMANSDTELRSKYYGVNSTPTSIIDGTNVMNSGGQNIAARSKFAVHADAIDHVLNTPAKASIKITAKMRRSKVSFAVSASVNSVRKSYRLRVALAEDEIRYQGANGISEHRYVVRKMMRGAGGASFNQKGKAVVKDAFTVSSIEEQLENYINKYERDLQKPEPAFKEKKFELDPKQLYLVAFVQDDATRKILQSTIVRVKR